MSLNFDAELTLETSTFSFLGHEPNNNLYNYYINAKNRASDKLSAPYMGTYDSLSWGDEQHHMTVRAVSKIGIKHYPHIGAMGFYKDKYTGISWILIPIHVEHTAYSPPTLSITLGSTAVAVTITPPDDVTYTCYKIIMRSDYFADEYVVYKTTTEVPIPSVIGDYDVWAIGYNETTGICSLDSNIETLSITSGKTSWEPDALVVPMGLSDLQDVTITSALNQQLLHYNSTSGQWENFTSIITITVNSNSAPALGSLANNTEYRCTNTALTTAPTFTLPSMGSTAAEFSCVVVYKSPGTTRPVITNDSGYNIRYSGQDVEDGVWTPVTNTVYRLSIAFDGIYVNIYVSGVS